MTKDDKVFFTDLIKGVERRFDGRFGKLEGRFDQLEERVEENSRNIRYNSMQIELLRDDISLIREKDSIWDEMKAKVDAIFEIVTTDIPVIKQAIMNHDKRISALEAKCG